MHRCFCGRDLPWFLAIGSSAVFSLVPVTCAVFPSRLLVPPAAFLESDSGVDSCLYSPIKFISAVFLNTRGKKIWKAVLAKLALS